MPVCSNENWIKIFFATVTYYSHCAKASALILILLYALLIFLFTFLAS